MSNGWLRKIYFALGPFGMRLARRLFYLPVDLFKKRPPLVPPRGMIFTGSGDYIKQGLTFLEYFKEAGLKPHHSVLDIGCGIGRMARPLTEYLQSNGIYHGMDIVQDGIKWCQKHISAAHPQFHFHCINLRNSLYNNQGTAADQIQFPFENEEFDFIFLTSVFTHMPEREVHHYLMEIHRMLKSDGICFATFFLLDEEVRKTMKSESNMMQFPYDFGSYALHHPKVDAANIAFDKAQLLQKIHPFFSVKEDWPGKWCKRAEGKDFQDILVLKKN